MAIEGFNMQQRLTVTTVIGKTSLEDFALTLSGADHECRMVRLSSVWSHICRM